MTYELAKQLKDAGFPQPIITRKCGHSGFLDGYYSPTLSELIEACEEDLNQITRHDEEWVASREIFYDDAGYRDITGTGNTPEEAVVKLWLEINKNAMTNT